MSVLTAGYILDISEDSLLINGQSMPVSGRVEESVQVIFAQLSQLTKASTTGLSIVIRDSRPGGLGEVRRTIPAGGSVTLEAFVPVASPDLTTATDEPQAPPTAAAATEPEFVAPAPAPVEPAPATASAAAPAPAPAPEPAPAPAAPTQAYSIFAQLAQGTPSAAVAAPATVAPAPELAPTPVAAPAPPVAAESAPEAFAPAAPVPVTAPPLVQAERSEPAHAQSAHSSSLRAAAAALVFTPPVAETAMVAAPEEEESDSIFKEDDPIVDEGIRTPLDQSITSRQRTEGFSLKSQARREVERRSARKRKVTYITVATITLVAALRIVGAVMAGPSGDYAAICVDARTMQRQPNATCSSNTNPFAQTLYYGVGEVVPAVGSKASGGSAEKPKESRAINSDVPEGTGGTVLDGAEVK